MRWKFLLLVGAVALGFKGYQELRLSGCAKDDPQSLSCAQLGAAGPGDNAHVVVTEFLVSPGTFVFEQKKKSSSGRYETVYLPIVPLDGAYAQSLRDLPEGAEPPAPKEFAVIL